MRILNIRFRNLNSLAGDWSIDLEAPEFESNGIFAITGPTGSGKSTILDAICLALYASTPRLNKVNSKEENDILTRHCGDCFAEVTFHTVHGKFRCCWSQHRARKKPNGPLQDPRHELFDEEGRSLASGIKEVGKKVEELTGMDFTRFTQSTLLAQGSFAAFLLSKGDERAALLEKMTGTGIYSEISKYIFEQNKLERSRLNELDTRLALCAVLSEEAETELQARVEALVADISKQNAQELALGQKLDTLRTLAALKQEHDALLAEKKELTSRNEAFLPSRQKLDIARRALLCSAACSTFLARREDQKRDVAEAEILSEKIEPLRKSVKEQEQACTDAEAALLKEKEAQTCLAETLKAVRALDVRLKAQAEDMARKTTACQKARISLEQTETESVALEKKLTQLHQQKKESSAWLTEHAGDASLPQHLAAMRTTFSLMDQREASLSQRSNTLRDKQKELEAQTKALDESRLAYSILAEEQNKLKQEIDKKESRKAELLQESSLSEWRSEKERSADLIAHIQQALNSLNRRGELLDQCAELEKNSALLKEKIEGESRSLSLMDQRQGELRQAREKLAEYVGLLERIRSYEEERLHLQDGIPCPLCGAVHHPFAEGNVPAVDEQKGQLHDCDQKLYKLTDELALCRSNLARLTSDQAHLLEFLEEKRKDADSCNARFLDELTVLAAVSPEWIKEKETFEDSRSKTLVQSLKKNQNELHSRLASVESLITQVEKQEEEIKVLRDQLTSSLGKVEESAERVRQIEQSCITLRILMQSLADELEDEKLKQEKEFADLRLRMTALSEPISSIKEIPDALHRLNARSETFILKKEQGDALLQACTELEKQRDLTRQKRDQAEITFQQTAEEEKISVDTYASISRERKEIFEELDTDEVEAQAVDRVQKQEKYCADCRSAHSIVLKNSTDTEARLATLNTLIAERALQLEKDDLSLKPLLERNGFCSAEDCLASCLNPEERLLFENQERTLAEQTASLNARITENVRKLSEMTDIPTENEAELADCLGKLKEKRADLQEELGALKEKLENNEVRKQESLQTLAQKTEQEKVCRRWADLNTLIGSSDGKAFRVYAQGLTLRVLLEHANRQLRAMTDRYRLVQDPRDPLALAVIDHYQADTVRTSRNLSGGESFLVSLSLALGLARMASRNVSVDSVFLDEGFGTLDEDSLNMALDMLAGLRQQGKTIGVISHMQTIRERISVRIQVEPTGSGRSRLFGPGIRNS